MFRIESLLDTDVRRPTPPRIPDRLGRPELRPPRVPPDSPDPLLRAPRPTQNFLLYSSSKSPVHLALFSIRSLSLLSRARSPLPNYLPQYFTGLHPWTHEWVTSSTTRRKKTPVTTDPSPAYGPRGRRGGPSSTQDKVSGAHDVSHCLLSLRPSSRVTTPNEISPSLSVTHVRFPPGGRV